MTHASGSSAGLSFLKPIRDSSSTSIMRNASSSALETSVEGETFSTGMFFYGGTLFLGALFVAALFGGLSSAEPALVVSS